MCALTIAVIGVQRAFEYLRRHTKGATPDGGFNRLEIHHLIRFSVGEFSDETVQLTRNLLRQLSPDPFFSPSWGSVPDSASSSTSQIFTFVSTSSRTSC